MGKVLAQEPLTVAESRAEFDYRFQERIGMMTDGNPPSEEQIAFAQAETMREVRLVKNACCPTRLPR
jgi:hypothetical protein